MSGSLAESEKAPALEASIVRCQACGRRVLHPGPGCPQHGQVAAPGAPHDEIAADWPDVPGHRIERVLGKGGFGTVFAAVRLHDARAVALKVARRDRPGAGARLLREAQVLAAVGLPHVPDLHDSGLLGDGTPYLTMTRIDAPTLGVLLARSAGRLSPSALQATTKALLGALHALHARGFVHRDLKPENIFIKDPVQALLIDFGITKRLAPDLQTGLDLTAEGALIGTAEYMSPEQCLGRPDIDVGADIYAFGIILYEMLAGHPPFWGTPSVVQGYHWSRRPPRLRPKAPISQALEAVVLRCLAKAREERFCSVDELSSALSLALAAEDTSAFRAADSPGRAQVSALPPGRPSAAGPPSFAVAQGRLERRTVSVVFFESELSAAALRQHLRALCGKVVYSAGKRYTLMYDHESGENPAELALNAAHELERRGVLRQAIVDLVPVSVQTLGDGSRRYLSLLFSRADRYPSRASPPGITVTPVAQAVLPQVASQARAPDAAVSGGPGAQVSGSGLRDAPLFGRDAILSTLLESAGRAVERVPSVAVVTAEAGLGKSHLARALVDRLCQRFSGAAVFALRAREAGFSEADSALVQLLELVFGLPAEPTTPEGAPGRASSSEARPEVDPVLAMALGWLLPDAPELRPLWAAPGALRSSQRLAAAEALRRRAERGPVFVVLDDAHHASDVALGALELAASADAAAPIWVCALARPSFDGLVPSFGRQGTARHDHRLEPLDDESAAALCRRLLLPADSVPDAAVKRLSERAENVPLLLVELIRGLKRDGFVRKHRQTGAWHLATDEVERLPDLPVIEWFAQRQIDSLSAPLKEHARLLALLGPQVTLPEVSAVLDFLDREGMAGEHTLDAKVGVQLLVQAGVLTEDGPGRARFRQELLREAFSGSIPDAQRRQMHLALYHHYEAKGDAELSPWLPQLARHAAAAGLGAAAARAYVTLADQARARHAYLEAELLYSRALEQTSSGDTALEGVACRGRGMMRYRIERPAEALDDLARARELSRARRDVATEAEILLEQATALDWMLAYKRSSELTEQAAELIAGLDSPLLRAKLSLARGRALQRENRDREAVRVLEDTVAQAERLGDEGYELLVIALLILGYVLPELHRNDAAECALERAISLSEEHRDRLHLMTAIFNRGQLRGLKNDRPGLVADFTRAIQLARQIGHGTMEWMAETNLGEFLYWLDDLDAAALHNGRALEIDLRRGSKGGSPIALLGAARIRLYRGDEDGARELSERLRASLERGGEDALPRPSDEVLLTMVELALRDAGVAEWEELIARSARVSAGSERVEVLEVRALSALRRGRLAEAETSIARAFAVAGQVQHMMADRLSRVRAEIAGGARRSG